LVDGTEVMIFQIDANGITSVTTPITVIDVSLFADPIVNPTDGMTISGTGEPGSSIGIDTDGDGIADETAIVDENGDFEVELEEPLAEGTEITVTQTTADGETSVVEASETVDTTPPVDPTVNPTDGMMISGTGEPGATIEIDTNGDGVADETAIVDENGEWMVTPETPLGEGAEITVSQTDEAGKSLMKMASGWLHQKHR